MDLARQWKAATSEAAGTAVALFAACWGLTGLRSLTGGDEDAWGWRLPAGLLAVGFLVSCVAWLTLPFREWRAVDREWPPAFSSPRSP